MRTIFFTLLTVMLSVTGYAQLNDTPDMLERSRADIMRSEQFSSDSLRGKLTDSYVSPSWVRGSTFLLAAEPVQGKTLYYLVNAKNGKRKDLFTKEQLVEKLTPLTDKKLTADDISLYAMGFSKKNSGVLECRAAGMDLNYNLSKRRFSVKIPDTTRRADTGLQKDPYWKKYSADSTFYVFGRHHDIYIAGADEDTLAAHRLTSDGVSYYSHTMYKTPSCDSTVRSFRGDWFRDSHIAYGLRIDQREVGTMIVTNSVGGDVPTYKKYKFEMPGDKDVTQYEINLIYADSQKVKRAAIEKFPDQEVKLVANFQRDLPFKSILFTRRSRTCDTLELCSLNPFTANVTVIAQEVSHPKVNELLHNFAVINGGDEVIWWSERDGRGAYFLYDGDGTEKNRITDGEFVAGKIVKIDTLARSFIFEGYGFNRDENPSNTSFFRVNFDGTGFVALTPDRGNHTIAFSDDNRFFVDQFSTVSKPSRYVVRDVNGRSVFEFRSLSIEDYKAIGWRPPQEVVVKAADGVTDLYGLVYAPYDLDTTRKYPIICNVYPGPQTDLIPLGFSLDDDGLGAFSQMGFVVIQFGYRGSSPLRGKEFYNFSSGNLRDYALADCKLVVEELARRYSYLDIDRVGIYGHSGGGLLSTTAILTYPDLFKVAVAVSGNHDNNIYAKFWGEVYHGVTVEYTKAADSTVTPIFKCDIPTNMELAANLKGRLMLITGEVDDNVHPANTFRMADALIESNKRFDMLVMPRKDHGISGKYYESVIRYYFEEHLKNPKPFNVDIVEHN